MTVGRAPFYYGEEHVIALTDEYLEEVGLYFEDHGKVATAEKFSISTETARRYYRDYNRLKGNGGESLQVSDLRLLDQLKKKYSNSELKTLLSGKSIDPDSGERPIINFDGEEVCIGYFTDSHIGAKHFLPHYYFSMLEEFAKQNVQMVLHGGDLIEGMNNRPDHVYSLSHIGYSAQMDYATELLAQCPWDIYAIDGNHDRWGIKSGGLFAVKDIASRLDHMTFLGHDSGNIRINGSDWMLWHGEDGGGSYAVSYRMQKIIESFSGGDKPQVLLSAHDHKHCYIFERNVHGVAGGALCTQSKWMKSTRKANKDGFHIIKAGIADGEIKWFEPRWYPFY